MLKSWKDRGEWRPNVGTYADPKAAIIGHIKACDKGIEVWENDRAYVSGFREQQLEYFHQMRGMYLEDLKEYRRPVWRVRPGVGGFMRLLEWLCGWNEWLWGLLPDNCEAEGCCRLGVRGNENRLEGMVVCDYCDDDRLTRRYNEASKTRKLVT